MRIFCLISLSLLETGEREFKFLFLLSKLEKLISNFSFSSRNCDREFRFLFLLSKWEKLFSNFSFSSRIDFFASRQPLGCLCRQALPWQWALTNFKDMVLLTAVTKYKLWTVVWLTSINMFVFFFNYQSFRQNIARGKSNEFSWFGVKLYHNIFWVFMNLIIFWKMHLKKWPEELRRYAPTKV